MSINLSRSVPALAAAAALGLGGGTAVAHPTQSGGADDHAGHSGHDNGRGAKARAFAADRLWLKHIAQSDLAEIATGTLAQQKGSSQGVKDFGAMLVADHTKHLNKVKAVAAKLRLTVPNAPNPLQRWAAGVLNGTTGTAFDQTFISLQIAAHQTAIDETQDEIAGGKHPLVRAFAKATLPTLQMHLEAAEKLASAGA